MYRLKASHPDFPTINFLQHLIVAVTNVDALFDPSLAHIKNLPKIERDVLIQDLLTLQAAVLSGEIDPDDALKRINI